MVQFEAKSEQVKEWFPLTYNAFLEELRSSKSRYANKSEAKIQWVISWGCFRTKAKTEEEEIEKDIEYFNKLSLPYEDRCAVDLAKVKVSISMKASHYIRTDRSMDLELPQYIIDMFYEVMKITMLEEQLKLNNPTVMESLSEFTHLLEDIIKNLVEEGDNSISVKKVPEVSLSMDDILDKISETGMSSLTAKELKFLEKMSKNGN